METRGPLGAAEVQTIGDAERSRAGAGDVARRLRDGGFPTLVRIEPHVAAVAVRLHRDAELVVADANDTGVAAGRNRRARLDRQIGRASWRGRGEISVGAVS